MMHHSILQRVKQYQYKQLSYTAEGKCLQSWRFVAAIFYSKLVQYLI